LRRAKLIPEKTQTQLSFDAGRFLAGIHPSMLLRMASVMLGEQLFHLFNLFGMNIRHNYLAPKSRES